uniref:Suppressor of cytokine signaling 1 n=1 Tax=Leptobrachium leishanense TaxID=445787 RepID=A0A8C5PTF4_9ANUR
CINGHSYQIFSSISWSAYSKRCSAPPWPFRVLYPASLPILPESRYRLFRGNERLLVERSLVTLQTSGFYWGPLPTAEAHAMLQKEATGTFLVRDSSQGSHLFSVSIKMESGPVSVRVLFCRGCFWLRELFSDCPVKLLELAVERSRNSPLRCQNGSFLQQLCRRCIMIHYGREGISRLPIQPALQRYIEDFPFKI